MLVHQNMIKLADYRFSHKMIEVSSNTKEIFEMIPYIDPQHFKEQTNNNDKSCHKKSDVYSVGILLWEISSGQKPFKSYSENYQEQKLILDVLDGKRETPITDIPTDYINIYTSMNFFFVLLF